MATITSPRATSPSPSNAARITSPPLASPTPSNTNTPSSSSIDLPRTDPNPTATAATKTSQHRNRAALRDYYNLKAKPSPTGRSASIASTTSDSTVTSAGPADGTSPLLAQLDAEDFKAEAYIAQLLSSASLRDVLRTESALVSEIRTLDGERKALVYDNYSKLIKAVGTIGDMQRGMQKGRTGDGGLDGVEALRGRMAGLEESVRSLGSEGTRMEDEEKTEMRRERGVVKKVLEAPARIEELVRSGKREEAEMEWARTKRWLDAWYSVKGVDEVRTKCQEIITRTTGTSEDG
jgi:vacuolar protein sorting-associated protein 51